MDRLALRGFERGPGAMAEVARLEELRVAAVESRIEAALAVGTMAGVIGELETLVREYPYRERLRALQMLALYRSGRQAEALRAYQRARTLLGEELGIEPSPELRDLEQRILEQDAGLDFVARLIAAPICRSRSRPNSMTGRTVQGIRTARTDRGRGFRLRLPGLSAVGWARGGDQGDPTRIRQQVGLPDALRGRGPTDSPVGAPPYRRVARLLA